MSSFFKSVPGTSASQNTSAEMQAKKDEMKRELENEIRVQQAQGLLASIDEKCFAKCITKPGTSMSRTEETCLSRCLDRYMEAFDIVSRVYLARIQRERIDRST